MITHNEKIESEFLFETENGYLYKSVTAHDKKSWFVEYMVATQEGDVLFVSEDYEEARNRFEEAFRPIHEIPVN